MSEADIPTNEMTQKQKETKRGVTRWLVREIMGVIIVALTLFIPAGRIDWVWGWAMVAIYGVWVAVNAIVLIPRNPELLAERAARAKEGKSWDLAILSVVGILTLAKHITAGLDLRYGWTTQISPSIQFVMFVVSALCYSLMSWAMYTNAFFSMAVRHQEDRGHQVVSSGPYRFVRHPAYVGTVLFELASPIMLGSLWALIPGMLSAALFILRTSLEDRTLLDELSGYREYAAAVRYRLLPGLW